MSGFLSYRSWLLAGLFALFPLCVTAQPTPLIVGLIPTLSPRVLLTNYEPFRAYLARTLKRPVEMVTATDFTTFHKSTVAGDYDIVVTPAHFARLAQIESGYLPLAGYKMLNGAILITAKATPLKSIRDLRGHTVATLSRFALITYQTSIWLEQQGLHEGTDYRLLETSSQLSSAYSVLSGESALAIIAPTGWNQLPPTILDNVQVLANLPPLPSPIWLANPRLKREVTHLRSILLAFSPDMPEGKQFFDATGYHNMRAITLKEMKSLDPYMHILTQQLGQ